MSLTDGDSNVEEPLLEDIARATVADAAGRYRGVVVAIAFALIVVVVAPTRSPAVIPFQGALAPPTAPAFTAPTTIAIPPATDLPSTTLSTTTTFLVTTTTHPAPATTRATTSTSTSTTSTTSTTMAPTTSTTTSTTTTTEPSPICGPLGLDCP